MPTIPNDPDDDDTRQTGLPALGETDLDEPTAEDAALGADSRFAPRIYQDDLDYHDNDTDPIIEEETDNPAKELGIPEDEYGQELAKYSGDGDEPEDDDMREAIEDLDENDDSPASTA